MSATRLLVLGLVRMHGRAHGYLLHGVLESWGAHDWANVKWGSIYHALKQLTKEGKLTATQITQWPGRVDYELTGTGAEEFHRLLRKALREPDPHPDMLAAGLAFLPALGRAEAIALLQERLADLERERDRSAAALAGPGKDDVPEHVRELFGLWVNTAEGGIGWTRGLIDRLTRGDYRMAGDQAG